MDRAVPGYSEGDLILGLESSAIGTRLERRSRFTLLLHPPRLAGHTPGIRVTELKNGPPLDGHGAEAVRDALTRANRVLPLHLRRSLQWDQGAELAERARLRIDAGRALSGHLKSSHRSTRKDRPPAGELTLVIGLP